MGNLKEICDSVCFREENYKKCPLFLKEEGFHCKICKLNEITEHYFNEYAFKKSGWYKDFQKTEVWKTIRTFIFEHFSYNGKYNCKFCEKELIISTFILHHLKYDYLNFFSLDNIVLICRECHEKYHEKYGTETRWLNLPDYWWDKFNYGGFSENDEVVNICSICGKEFVGKYYYKSCKDCYFEEIYEDKKDNWY